jgi:poly-gamma-glutamate capsule biosynthesis protein CapA/YwtB (metallophosphatase superfamily)
MTFRTTALTVVAASLAFAGAVSSLTAQAQTSSDSQWRASATTLATLLQDGYKIVAVVNDTHGSAGAADVIFVQRDQSAFKCIDPQQSDAKAKAPACYELAPSSGPAAASEAK